jgi:hypothetical protein
VTGRLTPYAQYRFLFIQMFSNGFKFQPVKGWPSLASNFSKNNMGM